MGTADQLRRRTLDDETPEAVSADEIDDWDVETDLVVIGGGGCGLTAALAASENPDLTVTVLEKTDKLKGNTSLSSGMIPAADTRLQREAGVEDSPEAMAEDIMTKNDYEAPEHLVRRLCEESKHLVHWFIDYWDIDLHLVDDFVYPGHTQYRMHSPEGHKGENLMSRFRELVDDQPNVEILLNSPVKRLVAEDETVVGVVSGERHDEAIRAGKVILACNGFAGNREMVTSHLEDEEIHEAIYFGYDGNTGDGVRMGAELGGELACMDAYQAYAAVAADTGIISTYSTFMKGGIMVNADGERFGDETLDYSDYAIDVLQQPGGVAYQVFDQRILEEIEGRWDDFEEAIEAGTYERAEDAERLADALGIDPTGVRETLERYNEDVRAGGPDAVGRTDHLYELTPPLYGAKVTGALFHTQGGLLVDGDARVTRTDGSVVENLYAGGGAAVGVSGHGADGYLSGNGLLTALGFGRLAGIHARETLSRRND